MMNKQLSMLKGLIGIGIAMPLCLAAYHNVQSSDSVSVYGVLASCAADHNYCGYEHGALHGYVSAHGYEHAQILSHNDESSYHGGYVAYVPELGDHAAYDGHDESYAYGSRGLSHLASNHGVAAYANVANHHQGHIA